MPLQDANATPSFGGFRFTHFLRVPPRRWVEGRLYQCIKDKMKTVNGYIREEEGNTAFSIYNLHTVEDSSESTAGGEEVEADDIQGAV